jgi:hypothetical protein
MNFILRYRDPESGGFFSEKSRSEGGGRIDTLTTSFAGMACLYTGHLEEALRAGDSLVRFLTVQPRRGGRFYVSHRPNGNPITEYPEEKALHYVVDPDEEKQWYFFVGYPVGFLGKLSSATGDRKYLRAAAGYFQRTAALHEDVYRFTASGKLAWGSGVLYKITRDTKYRSAAERICDYLLTLQNEDGSWLHRGAFRAMSEQPRHVTLDVTHEFVSWLAEVALDLG